MSFNCFNKNLSPKKFVLRVAPTTGKDWTHSNCIPCKEDENDTESYMSGRFYRTLYLMLGKAVSHLESQPGMEGSASFQDQLPLPLQKSNDSKKEVFVSMVRNYSTLFPNRSETWRTLIYPFLNGNSINIYGLSQTNPSVLGTLLVTELNPTA